MAITKTEKIRQITINMPSGNDMRHYLNIQSTVKWDDPDDNELPVSKDVFREIRYSTFSVDGEGVQEEILTDISGEPQLIKDICNVLWSE